MINKVNQFLIRCLENTDFYSSEEFLDRKSFYKSFFILLGVEACSVFSALWMAGGLVELLDHDLDVINSALAWLKILSLPLSITGSSLIYKAPRDQWMMFPVFWILIVVIGIIGFSVNLVHVVLPGTEDRRKEVFAFHVANEGIEDSEARLTEIKETKGDHSLEYNFQLAKVDIDYFLTERKITAQSLVRFIKERYKTDESEVNCFFIFMMLTLPRHLSIDGVKQILTAAAQHNVDKAKLISLYSDYWGNSLVRPAESYNSLLGQKDEAQVKYLLTKNYKPLDYVTLIATNMSFPHSLNFEGTSIIEIINHDKKTIQHSGLSKFKFGLEDSGLNFKLLVTKQDYKKARSEFRNCVLTYFEKRHYDIVCVYNQGKPLACVSVRFNSIEEARGPVNNELPKELHSKIETVILKFIS